MRCWREFHRFYCSNRTQHAVWVLNVGWQTAAVERRVCEHEKFNDLNIHLYLTLNFGTALEHLKYSAQTLWCFIKFLCLSWGSTITQNSIRTISDLDRSRLTDTKVSLRQVLSLGGHLWNASRAAKSSSYLFEWGNIKFSKTVRLAEE